MMYRKAAFRVSTGFVALALRATGARTTPGADAPGPEDADRCSINSYLKKSVNES